MNALNHPREENTNQVIRHDQTEVSLAGRGIKNRFRSDRGADGQQYFTDGDCQLKRIGGRLHGAAYLHKQVIPEVFSKPTQYAACGGLGHVKAFGSTGNVLLVQEHVQGHEQIQIQVVESHCDASL